MRRIWLATTHMDDFVFSPTEDWQWHKLYHHALMKYEAHLTELPGVSGDKYRDYFEYLVLMDRGVQ